MMGPTSGWETTKTVSLWVQPLGTSPVCAPASVCDAIFGDRPRWWGISRGVVSGNDRLWVWNYDGNEDGIGIPYTIGEWVHITLVHGGGVLRAYKNGVEVGNTPSGATEQPSTGGLPVLQIGSVITGQNWSFEGQIDEVNIWNIARTPAEILQDLYHIYTGAETGLVAYYRMSDGSGTSLTDNSSASWTGTLFDGNSTVGNGPLWVASGAFDGQ